MKKMLFALPAVLLALFLSGCGKTPDEELMEKVPATANSLCLVDGHYVVQTESYKNHRREILDALKDKSLTEDIFQCRILIFGSTKEEWGGALVQSANGQVKKIFENILSEGKKDNSIKNLKESSEKGKRKITATVEGKPILVVLYHDNLMLISALKTDPAFFKAAAANPLFQQISMKNTILSAAIKVELPQQGKSKESADMLLQMIPALQKLTSASINIPFSANDPEVDFRMFFQNEAAAGEMLATVNMGMGFLTQGGKETAELANLLKRKTDKNAVCISFNVKAVEKAVQKIQQAADAKKAAAKSAANPQEKAAPAAKPAASPAPAAKPAASPAPAAKPAASPAPAAKPAANPAPAAKPAASPAPAAKPAASPAPAPAM